MIQLLSTCLLHPMGLFPCHYKTSDSYSLPQMNGQDTHAHTLRFLFVPFKNPLLCFLVLEAPFIILS